MQVNRAGESTDIQKTGKQVQELIIHQWSGFSSAVGSDMEVDGVRD